MSMLLNLEKFPCPVCGHRVHRLPPGSHGVCPVCCWEDDLCQLRFAKLPGSANHVSLVHAQENYSEYRAAEKRNMNNVREPLSGEERDDEWRPIDPEKDNIEYPARDTDYKNSYPEDTTVLYYWRRTYWRKLVS